MMDFIKVAIASEILLNEKSAFMIYVEELQVNICNELKLLMLASFFETSTKHIALEEELSFCQIRSLVFYFKGG